MTLFNCVFYTQRYFEKEVHREQNAMYVFEINIYINKTS